MNLWQTTAGSGCVNTITIKDGSGNPLVMTGTESLVCEVWAGGDQAPLFTSTPTANTPASGQWDVAILPAQTTGMGPGRYSVIVKYSDGTSDAWYGDLEITNSPGSSTPGKVYGSYADMLKVASWVARVQSDADESQFLEQRVDARAWLDDILLKSYRGSFYGQFDELSMALGSWLGGGQRRSTLSSQWLREQLDNDALIIRTDILKAVSYKAASDVGLNQIGFDAKLAAKGAWCLQMAEAIATNLVAELDTDGDGNPDCSIPVIASNTLFT